jgi:hypothetical protein
MDVVVEFTESAFRHGISKADILNAWRTRIYDGLLQTFPEKYGIIGFDRAGRALELAYTPVDDQSVLVFHAMKLRGSFRKQLGL